MLKISVVIPCFNESDGISGVIDSIPKSVFELIVVDNNSTDDTAHIAQEKGARVVNEGRMGYGYALMAGFQAASGDVIITLDGDGQYPGYDVVRAASFLEEKNLDFLTCSRFPLDDKKSLNTTRRLGNIGFTIFTNVLFGLSFSDAWSGMMCFKKEILPLLKLESVDMPISQEMKIKAVMNSKLCYGEMHIGYKSRVGESKLLPLRHGLMMLRYAFLLRFDLRKKKDGISQSA